MLSDLHLFFLSILYWHRFYCSHFIDEKINSEGINNSSKGTCQLECVLINLHWPRQSPFIFSLAVCPEGWPPHLGSLACWPPVGLANEGIYSSFPSAQLPPCWVTILAAAAFCKPQLLQRSSSQASLHPFLNWASTSALVCHSLHYPNFLLSRFTENLLPSIWYLWYLTKFLNPAIPQVVSDHPSLPSSRVLLSQFREVPSSLP